MADLADTASQPGRFRQARYAARMRGAGLVQVSVWVPADTRATIQDLAEDLRAEAGLSCSFDPHTRQLDLFAYLNAMRAAGELR